VSILSIFDEFVENSGFTSTAASPPFFVVLSLNLTSFDNDW
jgi:hypothetical protein